MSSLAKEGDLNFFLKLLILFFAVILQLTLIPHFSINKVEPNLVLLLVIFFGFFEGELNGSLWGFLSGFFLDLFTLSFFGVNMLLKTLTGFFSGLTRKAIAAESPLIISFFVFFASLLSQIIYFLLLFTIGAKLSFGVTFYRKILFLALYNSSISFLIAPLFLKVYCQKRITTEGEKF